MASVIDDQHTPTPRPPKVFKVPDRVQIADRGSPKPAGSIHKSNASVRVGDATMKEPGTVMKAGRAAEPGPAAVGPPRMRPLKAGRTATKEAPGGNGTSSAQPTPAAAPPAATARPGVLASTTSTTPGRTPRRVRPPVKAVRPRASLASRPGLMRPPSSHSVHSDTAQTVSASSETAPSTMGRAPGTKPLRTGGGPAGENSQAPPTMVKSGRPVSSTTTPGRPSGLAPRGAPASTVRQPARQLGSRLPVATPAQHPAARKVSGTGVSTAMNRGHLLRRRSSAAFGGPPAVPSADSMPAPPSSLSSLPPSMSSLSISNAFLGASIKSSISATSLRELRRAEGSAASWSTVDNEGDDSWTASAAASIDVGLSPASLDDRPTKLPKLVRSQTANTSVSGSLVRSMARSYEQLSELSSASPPTSIPSRGQLGYPSPHTPHASSLQAPGRAAPSASFSPALEALAASLRARSKPSTSIEEMLASGAARPGPGTPGRMLTDADSTQAMVEDITMSLPPDLTPDRPPPARGLIPRPRIVSKGSTPETPQPPTAGRRIVSGSAVKRSAPRTSTQARVVGSIQVSSLSQELEAARAREKVLVSELVKSKEVAEALRKEEARALALEEQLEELRATQAISETEAAATMARLAEETKRTEATKRAKEEAEARVDELEQRSRAGMDVPLGVAEARVEAAGAQARSAYRLVEQEAWRQAEAVKGQLEFLACVRAMLFGTTGFEMECA